MRLINSNLDEFHLSMFSSDFSNHPSPWFNPYQFIPTLGECQNDPQRNKCPRNSENRKKKFLKTTNFGPKSPFLDFDPLKNREKSKFQKSPNHFFVSSPKLSPDQISALLDL